MPIALLKFPTDLLREVFRLCDPFELYKLSKCSKRTQRTIMLGDTRNWKISFYGGNEMLVSIDYSYYYFNQAMNPKHYFQTNLGGYTNHMFIEFPVEGVFDLFVYLTNTFGIRTIKSLQMIFGSFANVSKVAKFSIDRNMETEICGIGFNQDVQDVVNFMPMLSQMNITQLFDCSLMCPPDFHFEFVKYPSQICIRNSFWFNINQLLDCTSAEVRLYDSMLSNQDLNVFLQKWKNAGAFPNLRLLLIHSRKIDNQSPMLDIIPPITIVNNPRIKVLVHGHGDIIDAVRVTKDDGTIGWLKVELGIYASLEFLICPSLFSTSLQIFLEKFSSYVIHLRDIERYLEREDFDKIDEKKVHQSNSLIRSQLAFGGQTDTHMDTIFRQILTA
ncbi:hypothetical protein L5515_002278 [Caenorhabditis briggsae]|uniref:F-box domain-containing protein n=1 Tax=Caenorhabditis briggsae TaxID=6238 RepID=A0AAE9J5E5_CAEBR|nr:hypothetical protein L5515_002278 [Caenorhabditis briggsae]